VVDVPKGGGDSVKVVSANGDKLAVAAEVGVELVLEVEEALVGGLGQGLLEPEDGGRKVGPATLTSSRPAGGDERAYAGGDSSERKMRSARARPSMQRRS
jgi:hypothetical protein